MGLPSRSKFVIVLLLLIASAKAWHRKGRGSKVHPPLSHQASQPKAPMPLSARSRFVIVLLLLIASAKASQGANTEAPNAPTSQPPGLTALVADVVVPEVNVRDRAVAFDRLCQSLAGGKDRSTKCTHLSAARPGSPRRGCRCARG